MSNYHVPVLATASIDLLNIKPEGVYIDATYGGGGHSKLILDQLGNKGKLLAFDQDDDALKNVSKDPRLIFIQHNFRYINQFLQWYNISEIDGLLADLGVSSHQFDTKERGFSFRFPTNLDMRMNQISNTTAADLLNEKSLEDLQKIFGVYGEIRNAKTLATEVVKSRNKLRIATIDQFLEIINPWIRGSRNKYLAQVFQALRIEVNDEFGALQELLKQSVSILKPQGRLVIISYHSLEDRLVKNVIKTGNLEGQIVKDDFGIIYRPFKILTKKPILPSDEEIKLNPRARSAKMRVAEKLK